MTAEQPSTPSPPERAVRIVAIGASAGGLAPCEAFFKATPPNTDMAYVVIQHLSPDFRSLMDELLARHSAMPILRVEDGMVVQPNVIYLNTPRQTMKIAGGRFTLEGQDASQTVSMPINTFFESLAAESGRAAVAVILSGTGSDGTKGCEAVRNAGGGVFVQEPGTAKFDSMPNSVIKGGWATSIASPTALPDVIRKYANGEPKPEKRARGSLEAISDIMRDRFGTEFDFYKTETIERRIQRRCDLVGVADMDAYLALLARDTLEVERLYNDLLIEVTAFFRDEEAFGVLNEDVVPALGALMERGEQVRVWTPGCASGEEPYSIAILLSEYARSRDMPLNLKIMATDIHHRSLDAASTGIYAAETLRTMSAERVERYFERVGSYFQVRPLLRRCVVFSPHDLLRDPPFTRMHLVSCRNVLIYLKDAAQRKTIGLFHFALHKDGYLFLGPSESVGGLSAEFHTIDRRWRIFRKARDVRIADTSRLTPRTLEATAQTAAQLTRRPRAPQRGPREDASLAISSAMQHLLAQYAPAGFLIDRSGELIHVFGDSSKYLKIHEGGFSRRIWDLIHPDLRPLVGAGVDRLRSGVTAPFSRRGQIKTEDGAIEKVLLVIEGMSPPEEQAQYVLLRIEPEGPRQAPAQDAPPSDDSAEEDASYFQERITDLENDLRSTEESLQTTIEELETSNEELQATNEELMAANEELQSTNEELHSVNEELYTVSAEHQRKIEELTEVTNDMDHLLKSTEIGTIFLDAELNIRRFTPAARGAFNLIAQDVGRPIAHVTYRFATPNIAELVSQVLRTRTPTEEEVLVDGASFLLRILPYTPSGDEPAGVVITTINIQALRRSDDARDDLWRQRSQILSDVDAFVVRWSATSGEIVYCNQTFSALHGKAAAELVGSAFRSLIPEGQRSAFFAAIEGLRADESARTRISSVGAGGRAEWREYCVRAIGGPSAAVAAYQATGRDVTEDVAYADALEGLLAPSDDAMADAARRLPASLEAAAAYLAAATAFTARRVDGDALEIVARQGDDAPSDALLLERAERIAQASNGATAAVEGQDDGGAYIGASAGPIIVCFFRPDGRVHGPSAPRRRQFVEIYARFAAERLNP